MKKESKISKTDSKLYFKFVSGLHAGINDRPANGLSVQTSGVRVSVGI